MEKKNKKFKHFLPLTISLFITVTSLVVVSACYGLVNNVYNQVYKRIRAFNSALETAQKNGDATFQVKDPLTTKDLLQTYVAVANKPVAFATTTTPGAGNNSTGGNTGGNTGGTEAPNVQAPFLKEGEYQWTTTFQTADYPHPVVVSDNEIWAWLSTPIATKKTLKLTEADKKAMLANDTNVNWDIISSYRDLVNFVPYRNVSAIENLTFLRSTSSATSNATGAESKGGKKLSLNVTATTVLYTGGIVFMSITGFSLIYPAWVLVLFVKNKKAAKNNG